MNGTLIIGTVLSMDGFKPIEESESIRKRFEFPSGVCVCGHKADSHWGDPEMTAKLPCEDAYSNGDLCRCEDYQDSDSGEFYE